MSFMDFSSWPREQEQSFVVYEQRQSESSKKAFTIGSICAVVFFVVSVGIYAGVEPEHKEIKGMNMDNLTKKSRKSEPKAEAPKEAPKAEAPAAAPAGEAPAGEAAPAEEKK